MALFIQKPVFWNTNNYTKPSGFPASSGFPHIKGYGHEEWNNSPRMVKSIDENALRFFHTERPGNADVESNVGQIFVFMTASHDGIQQFVGIAANATCISGDEHREVRAKYAEMLGLSGWSDDVWNLEIVKTKYKGNHEKFLKEWKDDEQWIPNWTCPDSYYWWFDEPITIDSQEVRGTDRWLAMFGSYTNLTAQDAIKIMERIPKAERTEKWDLIVDSILSSSDAETPVELQFDESDKSGKVLNKQRMAAARVGQGQFRQSLIGLWNGMCAVTGLDCPALLKASHIKPWSTSNNNEKLDPYNGLLLSSNLDSLFDKGLISFNDDGSMLVSTLLSKRTQQHLKLPMSLNVQPNKKSFVYLKFHREKMFMA